MDNESLLQLLEQAWLDSGQTRVAEPEVTPKQESEVKEPVEATPTTDVKEELRDQMAFPTFGA